MCFIASMLYEARKRKESKEEERNCMERVVVTVVRYSGLLPGTTGKSIAIADKLLLQRQENNLRTE